MVTCATPTCLRSPADNDTQCIHCQRGMKPMTNPLSPQAAGNSLTPKVLGPQTGMPLGDKLGFPIILPKKPTVIPKQTVGTKVIKTKEEIKILNKVAVEQIFNSYWYGWKNGHPTLFDEIFSEYGNFIHFSVKPSTMVGTPDTHFSTINSSGHAQFAVFVMIHKDKLESNGSIQRQFSRNAHPAVSQILHGISPQDTFAILENNGKPYNFTKVGNGDTYLYDDNGIQRKLPKWAIA